MIKSSILLLVTSRLLVSAVNIDNAPRCLACDRSAYREMTKKSIKEEILRKLGFSHAPNVTGKYYLNVPFVQKQIEELKMLDSQEGYQNDWTPGFHYHYDEDDYHFQPQTITIMPSQPPVYLRTSATMLFFKLSDRVISSERDLVDAILNIHLPAAPSKAETHAVIQVHYVSKDKTGKIFLSRAKENTVELRTDAGGRVEIFLTHLTRIWMKDPSENLGIAIKVHVGPEGKTKRKELEIGQVGSDQGPYFQIRIEDGAWRNRVKRTANKVCSDDIDPNVTSCCMWPLEIDFNDYKWDWVLYPRKFDANICGGDCSVGNPAEYPHTNLIMLAEQDLPSSTSGPCCAPRKLSAINMLYLDEEFNVILGKVPGMKVERCGCA